MQLREDILSSAARDYKILLDLGYPQRLALNVVSTKWMLNRSEQLALYRCVHKSEAVAHVLARKVTLSVALRRGIAIDFYNVALTLKAALKGSYILLSDDGFLRDIYSIAERRKFEELVEAVEVIAKSLRSMNVTRVTLLVDKQVSYSAEHAAILKSALKDKGMQCTVKLCRTNDKELISREEVVCSSDIVVLMNSRLVMDLAAHIISLNRIECRIVPVGLELKRVTYSLHNMMRGGPVA